MSSAFDYAPVWAANLPAPAVRWAGSPKYNFTGGNNDSDEIPIDGMIDAANSVMRREGESWAPADAAELKADDTVALRFTANANGYLSIDGAPPVFRETEHFFLDLPAFAEQLTSWIERQEHWRPNVRNF